jgi:hypothetical protein
LRLRLRLRLLDASDLEQAVGCHARCCAAHSPTEAAHRTDMDILTSLCEHSPQQTGKLLDRTANSGLHTAR